MLTLPLHLRLVSVRGREERCGPHGWVRLAVVGSKKRHFEHNKRVIRSTIRFLKYPHHSLRSSPRGDSWGREVE